MLTNLFISDFNILIQVTPFSLVAWETETLFNDTLGFTAYGVTNRVFEI